MHPFMFAILAVAFMPLAGIAIQSARASAKARRRERMIERFWDRIQ